jgi:hypothetical protein
MPVSDVGEDAPLGGLVDENPGLGRQEDGDHRTAASCTMRSISVNALCGPLVHDTHCDIRMLDRGETRNVGSDDSLAMTS